MATTIVLFDLFVESLSLQLPVENINLDRKPSDARRARRAGQEDEVSVR